MAKNMKAFSSFSVDDINKAKKFYSGVLGIKVDKAAWGLNLHTMGSEVFVYEKPNHKPATFTVLNFMVDDIDDAVARLARAGIRFEKYKGAIKTDKKGIARGASSGKGPSMAWFKDPAGNILSVIEKN